MVWLAMAAVSVRRIRGPSVTSFAFASRVSHSASSGAMPPSGPIDNQTLTSSFCRETAQGMSPTPCSVGRARSSSRDDQDHVEARSIPHSIALTPFQASSLRTSGALSAGASASPPRGAMLLPVAPVFFAVVLAFEPDHAANHRDRRRWPHAPSSVALLQRSAPSCPPWAAPDRASLRVPSPPVSRSFSITRRRTSPPSVGVDFRPIAAPGRRPAPPRSAAFQPQHAQRVPRVLRVQIGSCPL